MTNDIVPYDADGKTINVRFDDREPWLTRAEIAQMYGRHEETIGEHIRNAFEEGELDKAAARNFLVPRKCGNHQRNVGVTHYNLDAILAVGYRVKSDKGTKFRQWATRQLRSDIVGGQDPQTAAIVAQVVPALATVLDQLTEMRKQQACQWAAIQRLSEPQAPAHVIGTAGARQISDRLKRYATLLSRGQPNGTRVYRSWLKSGANELASRIGYFGSGKSWMNMSFHDLAKARSILDEMVSRAEKLAPATQTVLSIASAAR